MTETSNVGSFRVDAAPVNPDEVTDPRIRILLERYAGLASAGLREVAADCYELTVPKCDRKAFANRTTVRIALSLAALEVDPDAEMAVLGSAFVEQLIAAVRSRGARVDFGRIPGTVAAGGAASGLTAAVLNGAAGEPITAVAHHPVGRLSARVTVRAGTSLSEYLADSSLFDLTTGIRLGSDVARACSERASVSTSANTALQTDALGDRTHEARSMDELLPMFLNDLEQQLSEPIGRQRREADKALEAELLRIDRYYAGILADIGGRGTGIPDAAARRAIEAEHARRRGEEIRRHEVRAVVHPFQLTQWLVPVERAEWLLESVDGHRGPLVGERTLVGNGMWALGCPHCAQPSPQQFLVCKHDHIACAMCAHICGVCSTGFCADHGVAACHVDGAPTCDEHVRTCAACRKLYCVTHESICVDGGHAACSTCVAECAHCKRAICDEHAVSTWEHSPLGSRLLCAECFVYCEGGTNEPVGIDEVTRCASCDRSVCEVHRSTCTVDGKVHCSKHLRRTDRSRRLVCEHDRATCAYDANATFATDEIRTCSSCNATACAVHLGVCVADGALQCTAHLVTLQDKPGSLACEAHRAVCRVDGKTYSVGATRLCPVCARSACNAHMSKCSSCARSVCTADMRTSPAPMCTTCTALVTLVDPPETIIAAFAALGEVARPRTWKSGRDASHTVVELDLGWTRRIVMTVPHGDQRAQTAVRHSLLGSVVMKA